MKRKKGQVWISVVLYSLIAVVVMTLVLQAGLPLLGKAQDQTMFSQKKDDFILLDQYIKDLAKEEEGSQRLVNINVDEGDMLVSDDTLRWEMETSAKIIEPGSSIKLGNVRLTSNADVSAYSDLNYYYLENNYVTVRINRIGAKDEPVDYTTSDILSQITFKPSDKVLVFDKDTQIILEGGGDGISSGRGYIELVDTGYFLDRATVKCHLSNTNEAGAELNFTVTIELASDSDFVIIGAEID